MANAPKKPSRSLRGRKRTVAERERIAAHAAEIGAVLAEYNILQGRLFMMFWAFIGDRGKHPRDLATDLWNSFPGDLVQRKYLLVLAKHSLVGRTKDFDKIQWLISSIDEIAAYRNIAAHTPMEVGTIDDKAVIGATMDGTRFFAAMTRLVMDLREPGFWDLLADDLFALSEYARDLTTHLVFKLGRSPRRPQLPSLLAIQRAKKLMSHIHSARGQKRRRVSRRK